MDTRAIGSLQVSVIGIGCNNFGRRIDAAATEAVVHAALDDGINFFDTADVYGDGQSEAFICRALGSRRHEAIIATKFGSHMPEQGQGAAPDYIRTAVEASLRRLGTDTIDLYQLHKPDPHVPIAETLGALDDLVKAGKVREIGCSNFSADQLREAESAVKAGAARFVSVQNHYSLLHRDQGDVLAECARQGLAYLPYFPLEGGLLTGKVRQGQSVPDGSRLSDPAAQSRYGVDTHIARVEALIAWAEAHGHTILDLAFAWLLAHPVIPSVIAGATKPAQVHANAGAAGWALSAADLAEIDALLAQ